MTASFHSRRAGSFDLRALPRNVLLHGAVAGMAGIGFLLRALTEAQTLPLAAFLGYALRRAQKRRALDHMKAFLGHDDWPETRWEQLWNAHLVHLGHTLREVHTWSRLPQEQVHERVTVEGREHVDEALRAGRGAMVLTNHLGNFFCLGPAFCFSGWNVCSMRNPIPVHALEKRVRHFVSRFGGREGYTGSGVPASAAKTFREGGLVFLFADFSLRDERNVWVPFGRLETRVSLGPALLALRHRVPVLCITCERLDVMRHRVTIHPPLAGARSGCFRTDATELTHQALRIVAEAVRRRPEQWWPWDWAPLRSAPDVTSRTRS